MVWVTQHPQRPASPVSPASGPSPKTGSPQPGTPHTQESGIAAQIAGELGVLPWQVKAAVDLLDAGSTVPFIARYRKEATGTLDDTQLRELEERLRYLRELEDRRRSILEAIAAQGALTPELQAAVVGADTKSRLEDIYLPIQSTAAGLSWSNGTWAVTAPTGSGSPRPSAERPAGRTEGTLRD